MRKYAYREGYHGSRVVAPDVVAHALECIRAQGELTARRVVQAAEDEANPLHPVIEHDNSKAADEYRLIQARNLIRGIVEVEIAEGASQSESLPTSVYVHVPDKRETEGKYVPLRVVADDINEYERALAEAQRFLTGAEQRFHELRVLAERRGGKTEVLAIALQGFGAVREALALLRAGA